MRITFIGTCSGTEPVRGFRHVSFTIEHNGRVFFFDAGESCSYTAHLLGINLLKTRAVFISHCHMDHIGGLPNLLWNINKLDIISRQSPRPMEGREISVFIPNRDSWLGTRKILAGTEGGFKTTFSIPMKFPEEGAVFEEEGFKVSGLPNRHLGKGPDGRALSFSYKIGAGGKSLVYSGDVKDIGDIEPLLGECDLLLMETGHHRTEDICEFIMDKAPRLGSLCLIHHGRAVLDSPAGELEKAREILGDRVFIARDRTALEI